MVLIITDGDKILLREQKIISGNSFYKMNSRRESNSQITKIDLSSQGFFSVGLDLKNDANAIGIYEFIEIYYYVPGSRGIRCINSDPLSTSEMLILNSNLWKIFQKHELDSTINIHKVALSFCFYYLREVFSHKLSKKYLNFTSNIRAYHSNFFSLKFDNFQIYIVVGDSAIIKFISREGKRKIFSLRLDRESESYKKLETFILDSIYPEKKALEIELEEIASFFRIEKNLASVLIRSVLYENTLKIYRKMINALSTN